MALKRPLVKGKNENQQFNRRKKSLLEKANELSLLCEAEVCLTISRKGRYYTYDSDQRWRPTNEQISQHYPLADRKTPKDFQSRLSIVDIPCCRTITDLKST